MRLVALLLLLVAFCKVEAQAYTQQFDVFDIAQLQVVTTDSSRNIYAAGSDNGQLLIRAFSEAGAEIWSTTIANTSLTGVDRIVLDADGNVYVTARSGAAAQREFVLVSLKKADGSIRFTKRVSSIDTVGVTDVATVKVGNSVLLYAVTTLKINDTNSDILAFRLSPTTGAEIWRSQRALGNNSHDVSFRVVVNPNGAPFVLARRDDAPNLATTVLRLSGNDGSVTFRRDIPGVFSGPKDIAVLTGNNNIGLSSFNSSEQLVHVELLNGNTGAIIREHVVSGFDIGSFSTKAGALFVPRNGGATPLSLLMNGTNGLFTQTPYIQGGDKLLAIDGADQIHVTQSIVGGGSFGNLTRFPAGGSIALPCSALAATVDNLNRVIIVGSDGDFGHVVRFSQALAVSDDDFTGNFAGNLQVPAPGVLVNDFAPGATLELVQEPTNGLVGLNQDGSINYVPASQIILNDTFKYKATLNGQSKIATVNIRRNSFLEFKNFGNTVIGSQDLTGFLKFSFPPTLPDEATITDNSAVVFTDPKIPLNSLSDQTSVPIRTNIVTSSLAVTLTATAYGVSHSMTINVLTGGLGDLTLGGSGSMVAGESAVGKITITAPAPAGGREVTLIKTDGNATIPSKVTIPAGSTFGIFTIITPRVTTGSTLGVRASLFNGVRNAFRIITPMPKLATFDCKTTIAGGETIKCDLGLDKKTPYNLAIPITYTDSGNISDGPDSVLVVAGQTAASFNVTTLVVTAPKLLKIRADVGGVLIEKVITVIPNPLQSVTVNPTTVNSGFTAQGTVTLSNLAPTGGLTISLSTNRPGVISLPSSVFIATSSWSQTFVVTAKPVTVATGAAVNAKLGTITKSTTITVVP